MTTATCPPARQGVRIGSSNVDYRARERSTSLDASPSTHQLASELDVSRSRLHGSASARFVSEALAACSPSRSQLLYSRPLLRRMQDASSCTFSRHLTRQIFDGMSGRGQDQYDVHLSLLPDDVRLRCSVATAFWVRADGHRQEVLWRACDRGVCTRPRGGYGSYAVRRSSLSKTSSRSRCPCDAGRVRVDLT